MKILFSSLFLFVTISIFAETTLVSSASEINNGSWVAGDTIVLKNGNWVDQTISIRAFGTEEEAIVLMAETPGEVILTGSSRLEFSGKYIIARDLYFKDGNAGTNAVVSFRTSSSNLAENCRLSNTTIINYNPASSTTDSKWISIYGKDNRVDHCTFINKTNSGTLLVVWLQTGITPNHIIDNNYFGYRNSNLGSDGKELNGQEIIRIGDSSHSMQSAGVLVENNFFEHCNGEIEIISNKSGDNIYRNNVFYECVGMLTLRHGNGCTVERNYFFGNGISNTGGVRVIGEDHQVYNNYFENLRGTEYRSALCLVRGKENSALNEYFQVKNALVVFNTMVNCKQSFAINYNSSGSLNQPPIGTTIAHNHVYNSSAGNHAVIVYNVNIAEMDVTWKNNLINQGYFTNLTYTDEEIIGGIEPSMEVSATPIEILEPIVSSGLANYNTNEYPQISTDLRGRNRGSFKTPGASQISMAPQIEMPERSTTGASFYPVVGVDIHQVRESIDFMAYFSHNKIISEVSKKGTFSIYDLSGRCLHQQEIMEGRNTTNFAGRGIFILRFHTTEGEVISTRIACN